MKTLWMCEVITRNQKAVEKISSGVFTLLGRLQALSERNQVSSVPTVHSCPIWAPNTVLGRRVVASKQPSALFRQACLPTFTEF
jgi:hypothetical protein